MHKAGKAVGPGWVQGWRNCKRRFIRGIAESGWSKMQGQGQHHWQRAAIINLSRQKCSRANGSNASEYLRA
eukprot:CAMPEP_0174370686 /NCGR_PEP_ID=MMETSP0811_2-20130205/96968_1 /TAXON_ID=73025 ORGANISM="Eutreptiella gymnastica-like, Strain CCMP1594" /NCGR_SAMPLE_ID=MMETSP0811_2 /ASSEMBLY_ACC=CAM_ASM_000667 /LENGTH=70 /DNA_ID=CAMNT_0015516335 /DNA_START=32 /DNA_END=241 /DNA_ORIENTATION=+